MKPQLRMTKVRRMITLVLLCSGLLLNTPAGAQCSQRADYGVGDSPRSVAVGDMNADGRPDIVTANYNSDNVTVLLQQPNGTYARTNYGAGDGPLSTTVGYVNTDTRLDIVTANGIGNTVTVLLQQADGTYARTDYAVGNTPTSIALGQMNADTRLDVVTANAGDNTVTVLQQRAGAGYNRANYPVGERPLSVAVGDITGDGRSDIVTANFTSNNVTVLQQQNGGTYALSQTYEVGNGPVSVAVGNLGTDDQLDIVTVNQTSSTIRAILFIPGGMRIFTYTATDTPTSVALGDISGDGRPDIFTANQNSHTVAVFRVGLRIDSYATYDTGNGPVSVALGDMNRDGRPDIVTANQTSNDVTVRIDQTPQLTLQSSTVCQSQRVDLTTLVRAVPSGGTFSFYPTLADAQAGSNPLPSATVQPTATTTYYVRYAISSSCVGTGSLTLTVDRPSVNLGNNGPLTCSLTNVTLTASTTAIVGSYAFTGPGLSQTGPANTASVSQPGTYTVALTTAGACPVTVTALTTVEQTISPPTLSPTNDGPLSCTTPRVTVSTPAEPGVRYHWTGPQQKGNINASFATTVAGQFNLLATALNGCTATGSTLVTGQNNFFPRLTNDGPLTCIKPIVTLTASGGNDYQFGPVARQTGGTTDNTATVTQAGVYSVTVTSGGGCSGTVTTTVSSATTLNPPSLLTQAGQSYPGDQSSVTVDQNSPPVILVVSGCGGGTITWAGGSATTLSVSTVTVGRFTYTATCRSHGCISPPASATVVVAPVNTPPVATTNADQSVVVNAPFAYTVNAFTDAQTPDNLTYAALLDPTNTGLSFNPATRLISGTPTAPGSISVTITATDPGGLSASTRFVIEVGPPIVTSSPLRVMLTASPTTILTNGTTSLSATASGGKPGPPNQPYTYVFSGPGTLTPSGNTATVSGLPAGVQTFTVVVTDATTPTAVTTAQTVSVTVNAPATTTALRVLHQDADRNPTNNTIKPNLQLVNEGTSPLPYGEITLRYWLTVENFAPMTNLSVYFAQVGAGNVQMTYVELEQPRQSAFGYVEYSFAASAGSLAAGVNSGPIQSGIGKQDWTAFDEADDYSWANNGGYTANAHITAYRNGVLVWGEEPAEAGLTLFPLRVYTENKNNPSTNTISTYLHLRNEGNRPISYSELKVRYYFTSEGTQPLNFYLDYAVLGNANVRSQFVRINPPLANADTYLELSFVNLDQLYPLSGTGNLQYRVAKSDWSNFSQSNDHSYQNGSSPMAENNRVVIYVGGQRVYGNEPGAGARVGVEGVEVPLSVRVLGNPVQGSAVTVEVNGAVGQPLRYALTDLSSQPVSERVVERATATEQHTLSMGSQPVGLLLLRVSTPTQNRTIRVLKTE